VRRGRAPTATSRVGQEWGRREGLRWLSAGVRMPVGQLGIPEHLGFPQLLLPGSIVVVLGAGGSSPLAHPVKAALTSGFTRWLPEPGAPGGSEWGHLLLSRPGGRPGELRQWQWPSGAKSALPGRPCAAQALANRDKPDRP
jgi:hypothetical protein